MKTIYENENKLGTKRSQKIENARETRIMNYSKEE